MKLEHLQYLLAVIDNGSINKAAKELFCTQPTLTNIIKSIEKELGYPVIERSHNGIVPTELGKLIVSDARFIIKRVNDWKKYANGELSSGNIDVLCSGVINHKSILNCIFSLQQINPEINIRLIESINRGVEYLNELQQQNYRFGLFKKVPHELESVQKFIAENGQQLMLVKESKFVAFINSEDPLAKKSTLCLEDIRERPIALFRKPSEFPYIEFLNSVNCNCNLQVGNSTSVILAAALGKAIAIRPLEEADNNYYVSSGIVTVKCFSDCPMPVSTFLIYPHDSRLNKFEKIFVDAIKKIPKNTEFDKSAPGN